MLSVKAVGIEKALRKGRLGSEAIYSGHAPWAGYITSLSLRITHVICDGSSSNHFLGLLEFKGMLCKVPSPYLAPFKNISTSYLFKYLFKRRVILNIQTFLPLYLGKAVQGPDVSEETVL